METAEQKFIRLLTRLTQESDIDEITPDEDLRALKELYDGGFISASEVQGEVGGVCIMNDVRITPQGRAHLMHLKRQAGLGTSVGFIKEHGFSFYKWFFGIVATIIAGYFVWRLTH